MVKLIHPQLLHPSSNSSAVDRYGAKRTAERWHVWPAKIEYSPLSVMRRMEIVIGMAESCVDPDKAVDSYSWQQKFVTR